MSQDNPEIIRIGVVGAGYWGPNIIRNVQQIKGIKLAGVCDLSRTALDRIGEKYPEIPLFGSFQKMIERGELDAVVIATPAATHTVLAKEALNLGLDVFVEKPLAMTMKDAKILTDIASDKKRVLMVGHIFLYSEYVRTLKKFVEQKSIGDLKYLTSERMGFGPIRRDVDVLWNLGPHDVSICNFIVGTTPVEVAAWGAFFLDPEKRKPDVVFAKLKYPGDITANIHISWVHPQKVRKMVLMGSNRMITYDDTNQEEPVVVYDKKIIRNEDGTLETLNGETETVHIDLVEPLYVELDHFTKCIRTRERPLTDGVHAQEVIGVLEALSVSIREQGSPVRIEPVRE
jgi:predicted dehydrogenase